MRDSIAGTSPLQQLNRSVAQWTVPGLLSGSPQGLQWAFVLAKGPLQVKVSPPGERLRRWQVARRWKRILPALFVVYASWSQPFAPCLAILRLPPHLLCILLEEGLAWGLA